VTDRSVRPTRSRAQAEEFVAEAGVVLGLAEIGHFSGGTFGVDDF